MSTATIQKAKPCASCPFMAEGGDRSACFEPWALERTAGRSLRDGNIHACHSSQDHMCAGYLSFAEQTLAQGAVELQMVRMEARFSNFDYDMIDTELPVFESFEDMLESHEERLGWVGVGL